MPTIVRTEGASCMDTRDGSDSGDLRIGDEQVFAVSGQPTRLGEVGRFRRYRLGYSQLLIRQTH